MVCISLEAISEEIMSPSLESMDEGQEFPVMYQIISFGWFEFLRFISHRIPLIIDILTENGSNCIFGHVCFDLKEFHDIRNMEYRCCDKRSFHFCECLLMLRSLGE